MSDWSQYAGGYDYRPEPEKDTRPPSREARRKRFSDYEGEDLSAQDPECQKLGKEMSLALWLLTNRRSGSE